MFNRTFPCFRLRDGFFKCPRPKFSLEEIATRIALNHGINYLKVLQDLRREMDGVAPKGK